jgi:8-amino-7-oxononanoate synthase
VSRAHASVPPSQDASARSSDPPAPYADLVRELAQLDERGLSRTRRVLESPQGPRVAVDGRDYVAFCSNDYLGLAADPELIEAARRGAARLGVGAGASHLVLGHSAAHHELEERLAAFVGLPRALLFSTGYMANLGVVTALAGRDDAVFADRLNHASLNDAALLSRATLRRYRHADLESLERQLAGSRARRKLIVSDAVFSMDGDIAPVPQLIVLCERYDAWLLLDDAHGFGVLGAGGRGVLEHFAAGSPRIIYMATLGKAAGVFGAFVAGQPEPVEYLIQRARPYIYTTATPPMLSAALMKSLDLIRDGGARRAHLRELVACLRKRLSRSRWTLMPSQTPIQPLVIGQPRPSVAVSQRLAERGLLVPAIRPPTVPEGTARLRISLSAAHSQDDVERLAALLNELDEIA